MLKSAIIVAVTYILLFAQPLCAEQNEGIKNGFYIYIKKDNGEKQLFILANKFGKIHRIIIGDRENKIILNDTVDIQRQALSKIVLLIDVDNFSSTLKSTSVGSAIGITRNGSNIPDINAAMGISINLPDKVLVICDFDENGNDKYPSTYEELIKWTPELEK